MKTVLTISDSVQGTIYDLIRCTSTIKEYGLDPLAVVPRISRNDGTSDENDVSEMLDYAFSECEFASLSVGFITEPEVILYVADKLEQSKNAPVICAPSLISDEGEVMVGGEVFSAICDRLLRFTDLLIINTIEAEAFCGFECPVKTDFFRAAKKIYNSYGCSVFIRGNERTDGMNVLFDGTKPVWVDYVAVEPGYEDKFSLLASVACEFANGNPASLAMPLALELTNGTKAKKDQKAKAEAAAKAAREAEAAALKAKEEAEEAARKAMEEAEAAAKAEAAAEEARKSLENSNNTVVGRTPVPKFSFGAKTVRVEEEPEEEDEDEKPVATSLVTPGKSLRDIARVIQPTVVSEEAKPAVTSNIEKPEEPKGEVTALANSRFLFDSKVNDSITSLQSLKDRLNNINKIADSGK